MKALSWKEPFASLMLKGKIETRTWHTHYRGWVLICSSKQPYAVYEVQRIAGDEQFERIMNCTQWNTFDLGKAIAVGRLVDCRKMVKEDEDKCFVQFREGRYCHVYENVIKIMPFYWKGTTRWKNVPDETINQIKYLE